ncbi:DUF1778 domain-containing protein [Fimbriimonas ginsengisoli]
MRSSAQTIQEAKASPSARLDLRITPDIKRIVEQAARLRGVSVSAYVTAVLSAVSREEVERSMLTSMSDRDRDVFLAALDNPPAPNKALLRAASRYREEVSNP